MFTQKQISNVTKALAQNKDAKIKVWLLRHPWLFLMFSNKGCR